jgi:hypothetical protein
MGVGTSAVACLYRQVFGDGRLKAWSFDGDGVVSNGKKREDVVSGPIGLDSPHIIGLEIEKRDLGVGNDRARSVSYRSEDICSGELRHRRRSKKKEGCQKQDWPFKLLTEYSPTLAKAAYCDFPLTVHHIHSLIGC